MYKILLADDEPWVVESLKASINWEEHGYKVIGMAYNGLEAFNRIEELKPDLVFTDIRMPGLNGLELIKKVKESGLPVQFIVASGYAEFAYAQKAMNFGAIGYCLKPFDEAEIIGCLNKAKQIMESKTLAVDTELASLLADGGSTGDERLKSLLQNSGVDMEKNGGLVLVSIGKRKIGFMEGVKYLPVRTGTEKWVYLLSGEKAGEIKNYLGRELTESVKAIGISREIRDVARLRSSIEEASSAAYSFFMTGRSKVYEFRDSGTAEMKEALKQLEEAVRARDLSSIAVCFSVFEELFQSGAYSIKHAHYSYNMAMSFIYRYVDTPDDTFIDNYEQLPYLFHNASEMLRYLCETVQNQVNAKQDDIAEEIGNQTMKEILKYVNLNFNKEISVQSISRKFFVNPNYISQLFKREVGLNYTEYLTKIRMDFACNLLKESRLSIQEIREKTGYHDYFYFTRIFKKSVGKTPSEYRNEGRNG